MSKTTIIRDSTQISTFLDCPRMWQLSHSERLTLSLGRVNDPMAMGTLLHKYMEIYYKGRASGFSINNSMEKALDFNPDKPPDELFPLDTAKRDLVKERFRVYAYTYSMDDFIPLSPDHVEVGFSYKLYEDDEKLYILEGRYDILADHRGMRTWVDHKGQMRMRDLYNKSVQFRNYDLVTEASIACINYIRLTQKVDSTTYVRKWVSFSSVERAFWKRRLIQIYDKMLEYERNGITPNDYNWGMCSGKFGYPCEFTSLCEESYLPDVVEQKKKQLYHIREEWKPW